MKAKHVEVIVAIAEAGSISAAAHQLGRTQPAVTKALKSIEAEIGCQVFYRSAHGVFVTVEGERIVARCKRIASDLASLDEDVAQIRGDFRGSLSVIVSPLAAVKVMPSVLQRYALRYPGVQVEISGGHDAKAYRSLRERKADFVIGPVPSPEQASGLDITRLMHTGIHLVTSKNSKFRDVTDPKILQTATWGLIGPRDRWPVYSLLFEHHGLPVPVPKICSDSILTILSVIEGSDMVCSFPSLLYEDARDRWKLTKLDVDFEFPEIPIALMSERGRIPTPAGIAFADLVLEEAKLFRAKV